MKMSTFSYVFWHHRSLLKPIYNNSIFFYCLIPLYIFPNVQRNRFWGKSHINFISCLIFWISLPVLQLSVEMRPFHEVARKAFQGTTCGNIRFSGKSKIKGLFLDSQCLILICLSVENPNRSPLSPGQRPVPISSVPFLQFIQSLSPSSSSVCFWLCSGRCCVAVSRLMLKAQAPSGC